MVKKNYKSKGRQSNGYDGYKSLRAIHQHELNNAVNDTLRWTRQERETAWTQAQQKQQNKERPRFTTCLDATNNSLRHIVRDRKLEDSYFLRERRRRNGFLLPSITTTTTTTTTTQTTEAEGGEGLVHPPGWILRYNNNDNNNNNEESSSSLPDNNTTTTTNNNNNNRNNAVQKLQNLSLIVFSNYIHDYQDVMGDKTLHTILSLLSSNCLMELSILLCSYNTGITNDDLAVLLGQHSHVERLCLRGSNGNGGDSDNSVTTATTRSINNNNNNNLTDAGILKLIPKTTILQPRRRQQQHRRQHKNEDNNNDDNSNKKNNNEDDDNASDLECWEEEVEVDEDDDDANDHDDHIDGIVGSLKLRRLELLDLVSCGSSSSSGEDGIPNGIISSVSADVILCWFDKCSGVTHLSLAGSFYSSWSIGRTIVSELHKVLPYLEVLDITRCPWVTESLIIRFLEGYYINNNNNNTNDCSNNSNNNSKSATSDNISRVIVAAASRKKTSSLSSLMSSLPIVYYYRGRFTLNEKQKQHLVDSQQHQDQDIDAHDDWW